MITNLNIKYLLAVAWSSIQEGFDRNHRSPQEREEPTRPQGDESRYVFYAVYSTLFFRDIQLHISVEGRIESTRAVRPFCGFKR